ncbi:dTMP kinase [Brooklawnia sp.]|uniref:dTMP kinase n=1 Tax=Brooklawnia sp. TaxID=2699740 RepID=UPI00311F977A
MLDRGLFIVFEGGDRVGKSTQVRALAAALELSGIDHVITFEPGDTAAGSQVRQLLLDPESDLDDRCETLLYAADKAQHVTRVVLPALAAGKVVVSDRYVDSMLAYQGSGRGLDGGTLAALADWATGGLRPDLTVVLDIEPAHAVAQARDLDRLEQAGTDFHARVRESFLAQAAADPDRYLVLPALVSVRDTAARIREAVGGLLGRELVVPELSEPGRRHG